MAGRISGITIEIGGDTTKLQTSLKGLDGELKKTQSNLKDIEKLLKLDPKNTELLTQKQKNLELAIKDTKDRLAELEAAQDQVAKGTPEWDALQREIIDTKNKLSGLKSEYSSFGSVAKQQVKAAGESMKSLGGNITETGNKLKPVSAMAAALVTALGMLGFKAVTTADDINTLANQTGISAGEIQKMKYAADLVDVSFEDIEGALRKMKPKMDENNETFKALGVSVTDADGNLRSATDVFYDTIKALSEVENETERDQLAMELFGRGADELAGIIDDGGKALQEFGDEAEAMGLILDQDTLDSLNETNDALDKMKAQLGGSLLKIGSKLATAFAPVIDKISAAVEKLVAWLDQLTPEQLQIITTIAAVVAVAAPLLMVIGGIVSGVGSVISAMSLLFTPAGLVIAIIAAVIAIGVLLYKNWDKIKAKAIEIKDKVVAAWNNMKTGVQNKIQAIKDGAIAKWNAIKTGITNVVDNIKTGITSKFDAVKTAVTSKFEAIKNAVTTKMQAMRDAIKGIIDKIKSLFNINLKLPIKLPHIRVSPGEAPWGIGGKGSLPKFSVDWYKKAYDNPVMFTSPTVLATPNGYKGFGDGNGAEIVMGLDKLRELVSGMGNGEVTVNVTLQGDARQMFKVIKQTNYTRTRATNYNALAGV